MRTMALRQLTALAPFALVAAALVGVALAAYRGETREPPAVARPAAPAGPAPRPVAKAPREGVILLWVDEQPRLLKPDGTELPFPERVPGAHLGVGSGTAFLSPDGTRVAFHRQGAPADLPKPAAAPRGVAVARHRTNLRLLDLGGKREETGLDGIHLNAFHWLGDGAKLHVRGYEIGADGAVAAKLADWVYEPAAGRLTPLEVPDGFCIRAVGPDGKTAVVDEWDMSPNRWHQRAHVWALGGSKPTPLLEPNQSIYSPQPRFSPDGKRLLCRVEEYGTHTANGNGAFTLGDFKCNDVAVVELATGKRAVVKELGESPEWRVVGLAWSPDGKKIALAEHTVPPGAARGAGLFRVVVSDPDGKNAKEVYAAEGGWLVGFDWR